MSIIFLARGRFMGGYDCAHHILLLALVCWQAYKSSLACALHYVCGKYLKGEILQLL